MEVLLKEIAYVRQKKEDSREVEFVLSTAAKDRHGTSINPKDWELKNYLKNPVAMYQHSGYDSDPDMVIGTCKPRKTDEALLGRIKFEPEEINPLAEKVYRKVLAGTLSAVSVGFLPLEEGHWGNSTRGEDPDCFYYGKVELLEISVVSVPSNPEALKRYQENRRERLLNAYQVPVMKKETFQDRWIKLQIAMLRSRNYQEYNYLKSKNLLS